MDCDEFDSLMQEMLDQRQFRTLGPQEMAHLEDCAPCRADYQFYQKLHTLTATPVTAASRTAVEPHPEPVLASVATGQLQSTLLKSPHRRRNRSNKSLWQTAGMGAAALVCFCIGTWWLLQANFNSQVNVPTYANLSDASGTKSDAGLNNENQLVAPDLLTHAELGNSDDRFNRPNPEDLKFLTEGWDESVVALDRQWQQMAVGRVRAHQIPGLQPAVYPITGAVEAFRKNMIVRNQNGIAAGVRW